MARIWAAEVVKGTYDAVRPKQVQLFSTSTCACTLKNGTHLAKLKLCDLRGLGELAPALTLVKLHLSCRRCTHHCVFCSNKSGNCVPASVCQLLFSLAIAHS